MERCGVCSEKAYLSHCAHCEKKICEDCKSAHMDILRREITRFNSQVRKNVKDLLVVVLYKYFDDEPTSQKEGRL